MITRQIRRNTQRAIVKHDRRVANLERLGHVKQNPIQREILRKITDLMAEYMQNPHTHNINLGLAYDFNREFLERSRGKGGKKPARKFAIPSVAMQINRTNPIGHFA